MVADIAARVSQGLNAVCNYSIGGDTFLWPRRSHAPGMEPAALHTQKLVDSSLMSLGIYCLEQYRRWHDSGRLYVTPFLETQTARWWDVSPAQRGAASAQQQQQQLQPQQQQKQQQLQQQQQQQQQHVQQARQDQRQQQQLYRQKQQQQQQEQLKKQGKESGAGQRQEVVELDESEKEEEEEEAQEEETFTCCRCEKTTTDVAKKHVVLCETCNNEIHLKCLNPSLKRAPRAAWYCPNCLAKRRKRQLRQRQLAQNRQLMKAASQQSTAQAAVAA